MFDLNHFKSRKFTMASVCIALGLLLYFSTILFSLFDGNQSQFLLGMFNTMMSYVAIIAGALLGIQGVVDWKHQGGSNAVMNKMVELVSKKEEIELEERKQNLAVDVSYDVNVEQKLNENFKDDLSYAPLSWIKEQPNE